MSIQDELLALPPPDVIEVAIKLKLLPQVARDRAFTKLRFLPRRFPDGRWWVHCREHQAEPFELHRASIVHPVLVDHAKGPRYESMEKYFWLGVCAECSNGLWWDSVNVDGKD